MREQGKQLHEIYGCGYQFAMQALQKTSSNYDKANELIKACEENIKIYQPCGFGYLNITLKDRDRDGSGRKLAHAMLLQGDWNKGESGGTVFTGQTIACSECSPIAGNHYSYW
jgi:hypothetical protein